MRTAVLGCLVVLSACGAAEFDVSPVELTPQAAIFWPGVRGAQVAFLDGDRHLDLLVEEADSLTTYHNTYLGHGDGTFERGQTLHGTGPQASQAPLLVDVDADGDLDILLPDAHDGADLYRGLGDGTFTVAGRTGFDNALASLVRFGDLDLDGLPDAVTYSDVGRSPGAPLELALFHGDGSGGFQRVATWRPFEDYEWKSGYVAPLLLCDFNDDRIPDVVSYVDDLISVGLGDGRGGFQRPRLLRASGATGRAPAADDPHLDFPTKISHLAVASLVNPLHEDIVLVEQNAGVYTVVLPGNGAGTFGPPRITRRGSRSPFAVIGMIADFNRDRRPDVPGRQIGLGIGDGYFLPPDLEASFLYDPAEHLEAVGDFNGDRAFDQVWIYQDHIGIALNQSGR